MVSFNKFQTNKVKWVESIKNWELKASGKHEYGADKPTIFYASMAYNITEYNLFYTSALVPTKSSQLVNWTNKLYIS